MPTALQRKMNEMAQSQKVPPTTLEAAVEVLAEAAEASTAQAFEKLYPPILVAGAGSAEVNGVYLPVAKNGDRAVYKSATHTMGYSTTFWYIEDDLTQTIWYTAISSALTPDLVTSWAETIDSDSPVPTVTVTTLPNDLILESRDGKWFAGRTLAQWWATISGTLATLAGNNTFSGDNSFSAPVAVAAPTAGGHAVNQDAADRLFIDRITRWTHWSIASFVTGQVHESVSGGNITLINIGIQLQANSGAIGNFAKVALDGLKGKVPHFASGSSSAFDLSKPIAWQASVYVNPSGMATPRTGIARIYFGKDRTAGVGNLASRGWGFHISDNTIEAVYYDSSFVTVASTTAFLTTDTDRDTILLSTYSDGAGNIEWRVNGEVIATTDSGPTGTTSSTLTSFVFEVVSLTTDASVISIGHITYAQREF